jgi:hypothetical protein
MPALKERGQAALAVMRRFWRSMKPESFGGFHPVPGRDGRALRPLVC